MKLILASDGNFVTKKGYALLGIPFADMHVGYITTASKGKGAAEGRQGPAMRDLGIFFELYDIAGKTSEEVSAFLADKNIVHVEGGDTLYLLKAARESDFLDVLKKFFDRGGMYIGTSAGAYIMGPSTETTFWKDPNKDRHGLTDFSGLGFVSFMIFAHYTQEMEDRIREKQNASAYPVKILKDGQAIFVEDGRCQFVGEGEEVIL